MKNPGRLITDASPQIVPMVQKLLMALSGEERFMMGIRSFNAARDMILVSFPKMLSPDELKRRLFQRIYGYPLPLDFFKLRRSGIFVETKADEF